MALNNVSLNKLLKILPRTLSARQAIIRRDARDAVLKERKIDSDDGGDFYAAFWCDAKEFFLHGTNLRRLAKERIGASKSKRRLYPMLVEGFLQWYSASLSGSRAASRKEIPQASGRCTTLAEEGSVRVHNLLAWKGADEVSHLVYPYFDKDYALGSRAARLGRWAMAHALPDHDPENMAILDVLRGQAYDNDNCALLGGEEELLAERYGRILREWESQKRILRGS